MKILPPQTNPPKKPTARRHQPKPANRWTVYRDCLRWDFGFTCPFCLLHEADLFGGAGGEGLGGMTVEHRIPRSANPDKSGDYDNCLLACRFCNRARSDRSVQADEAALLDPTEASWSEHFAVAGDRLVTKSADAGYTAASYDINDPRKVKRREVRRKLIEDRLQLAGLLMELPELLRLADRQRTDDLKGFGRWVLKIKELREQSLRALSDLDRYAVVPKDAPDRCRCDNSENHTLPEALDRQSIEVPASR